jgi:hypothetical protein
MLFVLHGCCVPAQSGAVGVLVPAAVFHGDSLVDG